MTHITYDSASLPHDEALAKLLVDFAVSWAAMDDADEEEKWPTAYLLAYARRVPEAISGVRFGGNHIEDFDPDLCAYHKHETFEERDECEESQKDEGERSAWENSMEKRSERVPRETRPIPARSIDHAIG